MVLPLYLNACLKTDPQGTLEDMGLDALTLAVTDDMSSISTDEDSMPPIEDMALMTAGMEMVTDMMANDLDQDPSLELDMVSSEERWPVGNINLMGYTRCSEDDPETCYVGHGVCVTSVILNRAELEESGDRLRVPLNQIEGFSDLGDGEGVCSIDCGKDGVEVCPQTYNLGPNTNDTPWTCQVIYHGVSAYQSDEIYPHDPLPNHDEMNEGIPFGSICRPPFSRTTQFSPDFCETCSSTEGDECIDGSLCLSQYPFANENQRNQGTCLSPCEEQSACPLGFECRSMDEGELALNTLLDSIDNQRFCFPQLGTCGDCLDRDLDGRGVGRCTDRGSSAEDCDDQRSTHYFDINDMSHPFPAICGADVDANCNGVADELEQVDVLGDDAELIYGAEHCGSCFETCTGEFGENASAAVARCIPSPETIDDQSYCGIGCQLNRADCDEDQSNGCEIDKLDPAYRYLPDCDGDGSPANTETYFFCDGNAQVEVDGALCNVIPAFSLIDGMWIDVVRDCDDTTNRRRPALIEVCDGIDNDCNDEIDDAIATEGDGCNTGLEGICSVGTLICILPMPVGEEAVPLTCVQNEQASTEICEGVRDEDCDGDIDNLISEAPTLIALDSVSLVGTGCISEIVANPDGSISKCISDSVWHCVEGSSSCVEGSPDSALDSLFDDIDSDCDGINGTLATTLFINSQDGSDISNDGSEISPFKTLGHALEIYRNRLTTDQPVKQIILSSGSYPLDEQIRWRNTHDLSIRGAGSSNTTIIIERSSEDQAMISNPFMVPDPETNYEGLALHNGMKGITLKVNDLIEGDPHFTMLDCTSCNTFTLDDIRFELGDGAPGTKGEDGVEIRERNSDILDLNGVNANMPSATLTVDQINDGQNLVPQPAIKFCYIYEPDLRYGISIGGRAGDATGPPQLSAYESTIYYVNTPQDAMNLHRTQSFQGIFNDNGVVSFHGHIANSHVDTSSCEIWKTLGWLADGHLCDAPINGSKGADGDLPGAPTANPQGRGADGLPGNHGKPGSGGGGSVGAGLFKCNEYFGVCTSDTIWLHHGNAGESGATGGCAGHGGKGGTHGGDMIGLKTRTTTYPIMTNVHFTLTSGGAGGNGGSGEDGGNGGDISTTDIPYVTQIGLNSFPILGGSRVPSSTSSPTLASLETNFRPRSGHGGKGGHGSGGGGGGGGNGGNAYAVYTFQGAPIIDARNYFLNTLGLGFNMGIDSVGGQSGAGGSLGTLLQNIPRSLSGSQGLDGKTCEVMIAGECIPFD